MAAQSSLNLRRTSLTLLFAIGLAASPARSQTQQQTQIGTDESDRHDSMKTVIVTGVRTDQNVLPTAENFPDAFGLNIPVTLTPRAVSVITRQALTDADVQSARDFSKLSADLYTPYINGSPSSPYIRGQVADIFVNGMRVGFSSEGVGIPIDFNSVESVDIVKGPAPALYGASQNVGGFIDLNTKKPFFDRFRGEISVTFGMYDQYRWTVDAGGLSFRINWRFESAIPAKNLGAFIATCSINPRHFMRH
jgi:outer membrane receptor for monomeric catechols